MGNKSPIKETCINVKVCFWDAETKIDIYSTTCDHYVAICKSEKEAENMSNILTKGTFIIFQYDKNTKQIISNIEIIEKSKEKYNSKIKIGLT
jgi:hypothetical protein